jgi:predicted NAD/FAD-binding protein
MLADPSDAEREILGAIAYQENEVVLHTDESLLPKSRRAWTSWNYRIPREAPGRAVLTYNMNILQGLSAPETYCVTLNQSDAILPEKVIGRYTYAHPVYSPEVLGAQQRWGEISGKRRTHYCGAYWGYGFHEDGVNSALAVCQQFGRSLG